MTSDASGSGPPQDEPLVSVGLPVYQGERFLTCALEALLDQDHRNLEILVSDNASTDRTGAIARAYVARDARVRYRRNEENLGAFPNLQQTLDEARGSYFMWAAHDDLWEPAFVRTLLRLLRATPGAALAFCDFDAIDEEGRRQAERHALTDLPAPDLFERLRTYVEQSEALGKANLLYGLHRTAQLRAAGGTTFVRPDMAAADMLIVFRVLQHGDLVLAPDVLFHKRRVASAPSTHPGGVQDPRRGWRAELDIWMSYFAAYEPLVDLAEGLSREQREALKTVVRRRARRWARAVRWRKLVVNRLRRPVRFLRRLGGRRPRRERR